MFHDCPQVGPALTPAPSVAAGALTLAHLFLRPVLAAVAAALAWRARRGLGGQQIR
jgi:hypothetical protein